MEATKQTEKVLTEKEQLVKIIEHLLPNMKGYAMEYHKSNYWFDYHFTKDVELFEKIKNSGNSF